MFVSLIGSEVEFGRPKVVFGVFCLTPVPLFKLVGRNKLLHLFFVSVTKDEHLLVGELINKLVSQFPQLPHNECHVGCIEAEKSAPIILGHRFDQSLDSVFGHLSRTNVFKVENGGPRFNLARDHGLSNHVVQEEIAHGN